MKLTEKLELAKTCCNSWNILLTAFIDDVMAAEVMSKLADVLSKTISAHIKGFSEGSASKDERQTHLF